MKSIKFPARLTRRRFAAGSVALAAVLASLAFSTGTAHASGGWCLDANAGPTSGPGSVIQWSCDADDPYQSWSFTDVAAPGVPPFGIVVQIRSNGSGQCLDVDASHVQDFGNILQYNCNTSDPYQLWIPVATDGGSAIEYESYGPWLHGQADCLDADAGDVGLDGKIIQWSCNTNDPYQQWGELVPDNIHFLENVGA